MSRHTGAVFYQVRDFDKHQKMFTVFADYHSEGLFSEQNAEAIMALAHERCGGKLERVRPDPAASARSGVGPAAASEYERTFGRIVGRWPIHQVADGLDQVELLLGSESKPPMLIIHPRCKHLIEGMKNYKRAERAGEYLDHPKTHSIRMKTSWTLCEGPFETLYPRVERCNRILGGSTTRRCCEPGRLECGSALVCDVSYGGDRLAVNCCSSSRQHHRDRQGTHHRDHHGDRTELAARDGRPVEPRPSSRYLDSLLCFLLGHRLDEPCGVVENIRLKRRRAESSRSSGPR